MATVRTKPKNRRKRNPHAEWKTIKINWKQSDNEENTLIGVASTFGGPPDAHSDIISQGAFRKTIKERVAKGLVPLLDSHIYDSAHTLGTVIDAEETQDGLMIKARLSTAQSVLDIKRKMVEGHLGKLSIGYDAVKERFGKDEQTGRPVRYLDEVKLFEISVVPIPANERTSILNVKSVVPYQDLPLANRDREWDSDEAEQRVRDWAGGGESLDNMNWSRYRRAFLYFNDEDPEQVTSYKLPIADMIDGRLTVVPSAIFAVGAVLQGARDGVDIPEDEIDSVRNHVSRYYSKAREEFEDDGIQTPWETNAQQDEDEEKENDEGKTTGEEKQALDEELEPLNDEDIEFIYEQTRAMWTQTGLQHFLGMGEAILASMVGRGIEIVEDDPFVMAINERMEGPGRPDETEEMQIKAGRRNSRTDLDRLKTALASILQLLNSEEREQALQEIKDELTGTKPKGNHRAEPDRSAVSLTLKSQKARSILLQEKLKNFKG